MLSINSPWHLHINAGPFFLNLVLNPNDYRHNPEQWGRLVFQFDQWLPFLLDKCLLVIVYLFCVVCIYNIPKLDLQNVLWDFHSHQ